MATSLESLPWEILSNILEDAARQNLRLLSAYTYGLSQAPEPGRHVDMQRVVRGHTSPDALKWQATEDIRRVSHKWHAWASGYALRSLYISRWRGSERWLQSRVLHTLKSNPSSIAVYRDPYLSLRKTAELFNRYPASALSVRRLWFNGYYGLETNALIFDTLRHCTNLDHLTVPWTTLRYGSQELWAQMLERRSDVRQPLSLEFLAVDLGEKSMRKARNQVDKQPLESERVDFGRVERLKLFGNTNFKPTTDNDLFTIARAAKNLREIHITGITTVSVDGVMALVNASKDKLQVLEYSPLAKDGFEHPKALPTLKHGHLCERLLECPKLRNLSISIPCLCEELFKEPSVKWTGEVQIRADGLCNHPKREAEAQRRFWHVLALARSLMASKSEGENIDLDIQLFVNYWIFEPRRSLVHGNIAFGQALSDETWPNTSTVSYMGPYGQTGLYGKDEGPYSCISEEEFAEGLTRGHISF